MGFWEQILDYFTRVDDILRKFNEDYRAGNARLISKLNELIGAVTGIEPVPDIPYKHVPFFVDGAIAGGGVETLLIKDDPEQGLGGVGRSGYFINDSADDIHIIIDDGKGKSEKIRIDGGERLVIDRSDNIWIDKLTIDATDVAAARPQVTYRCSFSR